MENTDSKIVQLAKELERQKKTKEDFVVSSDDIKTDVQTMENGTKVLMMHFPRPMGYFEEEKGFGITEHTHSQISDKLKIPKGFYDRLKADYPELLVKNINELMPEREKKVGKNP